MRVVGATLNQNVLNFFCLKKTNMALPPNEDNALVTLPGYLLSQIGSFLSPKDRANARVSRGLSIPFSRQTLRTFRITVRRTIKYKKFPQVPNIVDVEEYGFFSDALGAIKQEDILKIMNKEAFTREKLYNRMSHFIHAVGYNTIWNSLPEQWKVDVHQGAFFNALYASRIHREDKMVPFFRKSLWTQGELYTEIMRPGDRTLIRSETYMENNVLNDPLTYLTYADYLDSLRVWEKIHDNIKDANPYLIDSKIYELIGEYFDLDMTVEILVEHS